jgi:DNA-binding XRE family transcriptional regulator
MPSKAPPVENQARAQLAALGARLRAERKAVRVSSTAVAEAAGISRVTLHRIEKGEPSVAVGAWANVIGALGLTMTATRTSEPESTSARPSDMWIPVRVGIEQYPQLKALAWHVQGTGTLTPAEALAIYERNARHLDVEAMSTQEQGLLTALRAVFGTGSDV